MTYPNTVEQRSNDKYSNLLDRDNLALGAIERINIAHRILEQPELTIEQARKLDRTATSTCRSTGSRGWSTVAFGPPTRL